MNRKCIAMFSGGLDSWLAARVMLEQGIEVVAVHFVTSFCAAGGTPDRDGQTPVGRLAATLGIEHRIIDVSEPFLQVLLHPRHGYGSNLNPCIDCKIFFLRQARDLMAAVNASFVVTGEVLGQRPMSQHRGALVTIEREAGLEGLLLRPLSARHLPATQPETMGLVDRNRLPDITGRRRDQQLALAASFGLREPPSPAGGCLLTDPIFTDRLAERLCVDRAPLTLADVTLLKLGRQFRLGPERRLIVARNEHECQELARFAAPAFDSRSTNPPTDRCWGVLEPADEVPGPVAVLWGRDFSDEDVRLAAGIVARYTAVGTPVVGAGRSRRPSDEAGPDPVLTTRPPGARPNQATVPIELRRPAHSKQRLDVEPPTADETARWQIKPDPLMKRRLRADQRKEDAAHQT